jgi:GYF domain 2
MVEMWYYTTEGKQQNPVALADLKRLFGEGVLKPTDMVWKEGMDRWIRASSLRELFADTTAKLETPATRRASVPAVALDEPRPQTAIRADDREAAPRRRVPAQRGGSSAGVIVVLVLGAMVLLGALAVGVFILIFVVGQPDAVEDFKGKIEGNTLTYKVRLNPNGVDDKHWFRFRKGVQYEITVRTEPRFPDVDLHVMQRDGKELAFDDNPGPDSFVRFTPAEEIECRVELRNLDMGSKAVSTVKITPPPLDVKNEPPKEQVKEQPLPPGVKEGKGLDTSISVPIGKETTQKFRVRAGHKASFKFVPTGAGPKTDVNLIVVKDSDPNDVIAQTTGPDARASVSFTLPTTEIVVVRIVNATTKGAGGGTAKGALSFDVSP